MKEGVQQFFTQSDEAWEEMLALCEQAHSTIDMEQYILTNDEIGSRFLEVFIRKAKEGVKIRLICDTAGSYFFYNSPIPDELRRIGIEIRFFNIISPWRIHNFFSWFFRDHRKLLVVDATVGMIGGVGIRADMASWRDTTTKVAGAIVVEMQHSFNDMWLLAAEKNIFARIKRSKWAVRGFNIVTNAPYPRKRFLYHQIIDAIGSAQKYVYLTTPYFVPNPKLLRVLKLAVHRGVDVRIIVPKTSDIILVNRASHSFFFELLSAGVRIYEYEETFIHAKTAVIDDEWCTLGSFNFDNLSFTYNHEANLVSTDKKNIARIKQHFETDISRSAEIYTATWVKRPVLWKVREFFILPFRRFL